MRAITAELSLDQALEQIDRAFGIAKVLRDFDRDHTVRYYTQSEVGYRRIHSKADCVHLALNDGDAFDPAGYGAQPRAVEAQVRELGARDVLELGCGKGFNSLFLAERLPQVSFTGLDLTPRHVARARRKAAGRDNIGFREGDFNALPFGDAQFEVVFAIECLCHSTDVSRTLTEARRVLRPGGRLVVFDGYRGEGFEAQAASVQTAQRLTETAMAVRGGMTSLGRWLDTGQEHGFTLLHQTDHSEAIKPTLRRLQRLSRKYFAWPSWVRWSAQGLRPHLVRNAVAGLLMPFCLETHAFRYHQTVMVRRKK
ncbi:MAG: methyltransferase domain-containing protein [Planctomycetota bacterium]